MIAIILALLIVWAGFGAVIFAIFHDVSTIEYTSNLQVFLAGPIVWVVKVVDAGPGWWYAFQCWRRARQKIIIVKVK